MNLAKIHLTKTLKGLLHLFARYLRRLSNEIVIFIPAAVLILTLYNILQSHTLFEQTKNKAAERPRDLKSKLILSRLLYQNNNLDTSEIELEKILSSSKYDPDTKLKATKLLEKIKAEKNAPGEIRGEINRWQKLNLNYPNSRDINLKLAFLNWKIYRVFEAKKLLTKAEMLDPNNAKTKKIKLNLVD